MLADVSYTPTSLSAGILFVRGSIGLTNARDVCVVMLSLIDNSELTRLSVDLSEADFIGASARSHCSRGVATAQCPAPSSC